MQSFITRLICAVFSFGAAPVVYSQSQNDGLRELPSLQQLLQLHDKPASHPEFLRLARLCNLRLYSRKEEVLFSSAFQTNTPYRMETIESYGGSGLVVEVLLTAFISGDLRSPGQVSRSIFAAPANGPIEGKVGRIKLIVGDCAERYMFGSWKGEMPKIDIPSTPDALIARYRLFDTDLVDVKYTHGGEAVLERSRVINYYTPAFGSEIPYAFEFRGRHSDQLAMIAIWPLDDRYEIIAPRRP